MWRLLLLVHVIFAANKCYTNVFLGDDGILYATIDDHPKEDTRVGLVTTSFPLYSNWVIVGKPDSLQMRIYYWGTTGLRVLTGHYQSPSPFIPDTNNITIDAQGLYKPPDPRTRIAIQHIPCKYGITSSCNYDNTHCNPPPPARCYQNTWLDPITNILYATLDDWDPQDEQTYSSFYSYTLYSNWQLVNEPSNNLSMSSFGKGWGTMSLIDVNGRTFWTKLGSATSTPGKYIATYTAPQQNKYTFSTNVTDTRIAIQHVYCKYGYGISEKCGVQDGQPSHCLPPPVAENKCLTHTWLYKGILYATLDDFFFDTSNYLERKGQTSYIVPPLNWVSKGNFTDMAIAYRWGTTFLADLDGNTYQTFDYDGIGGKINGQTGILIDTQIQSYAKAYKPVKSDVRIAIQHLPCPRGVSTTCNMVEKNHCVPIMYGVVDFPGVRLDLRSFSSSQVNNEATARPDNVRQPLTTSLEPRELVSWDQAKAFEDTCLASKLSDCIFFIDFQNELPGNVSWQLTLTLTRKLCSDRFTNTGSNDIRYIYVTEDKKWYFTMYAGECITLQSGTAILALDKNQKISKPSPCPSFGDYNLPAPINIPSPTGFQFFYELPFAEYWITSACNVFWASSIATAVFPNAGKCNYYSVGANISAWSLSLSTPGSTVVRKRTGCPILGSNQLLLAPAPFVPYTAVPAEHPDTYVVTFPRQLEDGIYINAKWSAVDTYKSLQPGPGLFLFRLNEQAETAKIYLKAEDVHNPIFIRRWMVGDPGAPLVVKLF